MDRELRRSAISGGVEPADKSAVAPSHAGSFRGDSFSGIQHRAAPDSRPDENSALTTVVDAYNQGNAIAQFELRQENIGLLLY